MLFDSNVAIFHILDSNVIMNVPNMSGHADDENGEQKRCEEKWLQHNLSINYD